MDIVIPNLAESVTEGDLGAWLAKDGERVEKDQMIVELETDKATVELAAEASGVLRILVQAGETVTVGDVIGRIEEGEGTAEAPKAEEPPARKAAEAPEEEPGPKAAAPAEAPEEAAPKAREPERAVPAKADREARPERPTTERKEATPADPPGARRERMSRLRRRIAERLVEAQRTAAILTTFNEIDMSAAIALREEHRAEFEERHGVRLGFMSLFAKASILALREFPELNAYVEGDEIVYHDYVHLGIAMGTPRGLVVPVLKHADRMTFADIERTIRELAVKARDGDIAIEDLQDGTFTITNGGVYGSLRSTPILNPPQSGILGMHKIERRPVTLVDDAGGERIESRPMMYVALSYDHRIVDGEQAVTFLIRVKERLESPTRLLLDS
ncbi:MAG TPA: 2-oxoglutarate dehydrogenase complex dihydrolipoyllysine-residue succinyltransferase [Gemmatimonadota bacterium]|nr:2-oxoglutarate dehydrogenase complex dihydrolipoyllysine-residue succinyltransferase [Gemmatimonadota bacterium]